jgi:hypothetical protein
VIPEIKKGTEEKKGGRKRDRGQKIVSQKRPVGSLDSLDLPIEGGVGHERKKDNPSQTEQACAELYY